jgi:predicted TIM-barrel fold metal-dependent hydrolase
MIRVLIALLAIGRSAAQLPIDSQLASEIAKIKAVDNHAHPVRPTWDNDKDSDYDALPVETMGPYTEPVRTRDGSGLALEASRALFGQASDYKARRKQLMEEKREGYANWVLDQLGIETMLANRVSMGPGLKAPRFLWVPFEDALMYPLDNKNLAAKNSDRKSFFEDEDRLLKRYMRECGLAEPPATLDSYLQKVVTPTLERHKRGGAVAVKFEAAYLRPLDFADVSQLEAARIYSGARATPASEAAYRALQDFLLRYIVKECGRLGMAVHFHAAAGAGGYFQIAGANPLLLESLFNDPKLRSVNFAMLHGGWPFTREIAALLSKPNVYADFSEQSFNNYPRTLAQVMREWLEVAPEKVLFATDAYPFSDQMSWEEAGWVAATTGRQTLGLALTDMMHDGEITRERALEIARMVLRENARELYKLK